MILNRLLLIQIVIDRCHSIAKVGLIHLIIANFCTWFEGAERLFCLAIHSQLLSLLAIVDETLEELHKNPRVSVTTYVPMAVNRTTTTPSSGKTGLYFCACHVPERELVHTSFYVPLIMRTVYNRVILYRDSGWLP